MELEKITDPIDKELEAYRQYVAEATDSADPQVIAELAWNGLQESINGGYMTQEAADALYYKYFRAYPHTLS